MQPGDGVTSARASTNHILGLKGFTRCGKYRPGWDTADADKPMCKQCEGTAQGGSRPMPDNTKAGRDGRA